MYTYWLKQENGVSHGDRRKKQRGGLSGRKAKRDQGKHKLGEPASLSLSLLWLPSHGGSFPYASLPWGKIPLLKVYLQLLAEAKASTLYVLGEQPGAWSELPRGIQLRLESNTVFNTPGNPCLRCTHSSSMRKQTVMVPAALKNRTEKLENQNIDYNVQERPKRY